MEWHNEIITKYFIFLYCCTIPYFMFEKSNEKDSLDLYCDRCTITKKD